MGPKPRVAPSGRARATAFAAMVPAAPSRFTTTTCTSPPSAARKGSAKARAVRSTMLPAENGTTSVTVRGRTSCARAGRVASEAAAPSSVRRAIMRVIPVVTRNGGIAARRRASAAPEGREAIGGSARDRRG